MQSVRVVMLAAFMFLTSPVQGEPARQAGQPEVMISGIEGELLDNVRATLTFLRSNRKSGVSAETIREMHEKAIEEINRALQPFGYYRPSVEAILQEPVQPGTDWRASYRIDAGPLLPIGTLEVGLDGPGSSDSELLALVAGLPLQAETSLHHVRYENAKRELVNQVRERGYLDAALVVHTVDVDLATYQAHIRLRIDTGPRYLFGAITFEQDSFSADYLARYLILRPGEPYSGARLAEQRRVLSKSGHFKEVEVKPQPVIAGTEPVIPVHFRTVPYLPNLYRGRVGWGTDTGLGLQFDWTRRQLGRRGQRFTLGGGAVEERDRLAGDLSYLIPLNPLSGNEIELAARHESKTLTFQDVDLEEGGETRIATNLASVFWRLPARSWGSFDVKMLLGASLVTETYDIFEVLFGNLPADIQDLIADSIGKVAYETLAPEFEALVPSFRLTLRRSDNRLFIRDGEFFQLDLLGAADGVGSNIDFWQTRMSGWSIRPIFERGRLLLRASLGYTDAESRNVLGVNFNQMPEYFEARTGGARSVRGYAFETLFPADTLTGGKHHLTASIEYEHEIIPDWSAAIFLDAGNTFNSFSDIDPKLGTGIGVRWRSPVGLARLDLGFPLDDADDSFQIYITVGPEF